MYHKLRHVELLGDLQSDCVRHRRGAGRSEAQCGQVVLREARVVQHVDEHCGRAVQHVALLDLNGAQRVVRVEELGGTHESRERHGYREHNACVRERVIEGQRAADARRLSRVIRAESKV